MVEPGTAGVNHQRSTELLAKHLVHRLGALCRIAGRLLTRAYREADPCGRAAFILFVQTFGDLVNFHPHIHVLAADGVFRDNRTFRVMPPVPAKLLEERFRMTALEILAM